METLKTIYYYTSSLFHCLLINVLLDSLHLRSAPHPYNEIKLQLLIMFFTKR